MSAGNVPIPFFYKPLKGYVSVCCSFLLEYFDCTIRVSQLCIILAVSHCKCSQPVDYLGYYDQYKVDVQHMVDISRLRWEALRCVDSLNCHILGGTHNMRAVLCPLFAHCHSFDLFLYSFPLHTINLQQGNLFSVLTISVNIRMFSTLIHDDEPFIQLQPVVVQCVATSDMQ